MGDHQDDCTRLGSPAWATRAGRLGHPACAVRVGPSTLPGAGRGVFAMCDLPAQAWVTPYSGRDVPWDEPLDAAQNDYTLEAPPSRRGPGHSRVGEPQPGPRDGAAQLCNDAIHEQVTGRRNNCTFDWHAGEPYLRTTQAVAAGEELLVEYHITYWLSRARWDALPPEARAWLECVAALRKVLRALGWELEAYRDSRSDPEDDAFCVHRVLVSRRQELVSRRQELVSRRQELVSRRRDTRGCRSDPKDDAFCVHRVLVSRRRQECNLDYTARITPPGLHRQDYTARITPPDASAQASTRLTAATTHYICPNSAEVQLLVHGLSASSSEQDCSASPTLLRCTG